MRSGGPGGAGGGAGVMAPFMVVLDELLVLMVFNAPEHTFGVIL